jgi:hypothetical protein
LDNHEGPRIDALFAIGIEMNGKPTLEAALLQR